MKPAGLFTTIHRAWRGLGAVATLLVLTGVLSAAPAEAEKGRAPKIFLIGGSTMASFPETRLIMGWGQALPKFFRDPASIDNRALSGRSTKSFIDQGHWGKVIGDLRAGDFLIMCWGTNDSAGDPARKTDPRGAFRENLLRFIAEARAKGATPILATQVAHRRWDANGQWAEPASEYVAVNRELAASEHLPLMEMFECTVALEKSLGPEGSIALHHHLPPGKYDNYPNGAKDDTHYCAAGALRVAELAVQEFRRLKLPFVTWLTEPAATPPRSPR